MLKTKPKTVGAEATPDGIEVAFENAGPGGTAPAAQAAPDFDADQRVNSCLRERSGDSDALRGGLRVRQTENQLAGKNIANHVVRWIKLQGAGSREQGAGSREQGAGSREQGAFRCV